LTRWSSFAVAPRRRTHGPARSASDSLDGGTRTVAVREEPTFEQQLRDSAQRFRPAPPKPGREYLRRLQAVGPRDFDRDVRDFALQVRGSTEVVEVPRQIAEQLAASVRR
jgi:hypothetical protein